MSFNLKTSERYDAVSQTLHWLTVLCILTMYATAWGKDIAPEAWRASCMPIHKSIGITILVITLFRVFWKVMNKNRPSPLHGLWLQIIAAKVTHFGLYVFLLGMPTLGWLMVSAFGKPISWFNLFDIPALLPKSLELGVLFKHWHSTGSLILFYLIGLHIAAALFHQFILKDRLIDRMLPPCKNPS